MDRAYPHLAVEKNIRFITADCFAYETEIGNFIQQDGLTLVLCDGGNKVKEFSTFASYLKKGDIIMVHDYGESIEQYKRDIVDKNIWKMGWKSSDGSEIHQDCIDNNLESFMQDSFLASVWGIRRKAT